MNARPEQIAQQESTDRSRSIQLVRSAQEIATFEADDPTTGYYNDLRGKAAEHGNLSDAMAWLRWHLRWPDHVNPVSVIQLGLGAWQMAQADEERWTPLVDTVSRWIVTTARPDGGLVYRWSMPHTYSLDGPWISAMAQGQAASFLVRASATFDDADLAALAAQVAAPLLDEDSDIVVQTDDGPVLQEYPTTPPAYVLNGWMFALWGLYDVSRYRQVAKADRKRARKAFEQGVDALAARLHMYDTGNGWSRYDLFPHPISHVASPFYHRLHVAQLRAMHELAPRDEFAKYADQWERSLGRRRTVAAAVARKIGFRLVRPRGSAA